MEQTTPLESAAMTRWSLASARLADVAVYSPVNRKPSKLRLETTVTASIGHVLSYTEPASRAEGKGQALASRESDNDTNKPDVNLTLTIILLLNSTKQ